MTLGIYALEKTLFEGRVQEIIAKTTTGEISILPHHIPLISEFIAGPLIVKDELGKELTFKINSGFLEVQPESHVVILVRA